ncbi:hypothetical protein N8T08_002401 [Aspergillus melleus]|uniref:Uncharacterized protein n=1 Tax=Aspergillus melleus TaxID=138277 RepID=A0ACC3AM99_9EURO|nr:hypothetical protein N8T08_002401 [Aspergillus melleus]
MATTRIQDNAFQAYTILQTNMTSELPSEVSYEDAAVLPLGLSTASSGLFQDEFLHLQLPTEPHPPATGEALPVWGGFGSVGSNAIQLGVAAGYEVIATASPKNFAHARKLSATHVVDYNSVTVVEELVS